MSERPLWFDGSIIGAVFALVLTPVSLDLGLFLLLLNLVAIGCFVAPLVAGAREGDVSLADT